MQDRFTFTLNDKTVRWTGATQRMLLWVLRTEFNLTGAKYGCGEGFCGACTVLIDGKAVRSCQFPMKDIQGKRVLTIEGLSKNGDLHPVQMAFIKHDALQCGYCTPGMVLKAVSLLTQNPRPSRQDIINGMEDNLCRCGTYKRVIEAVQEATQMMAQGGSE